MEKEIGRISGDDGRLSPWPWLGTIRTLGVRWSGAVKVLVIATALVLVIVDGFRAVNHATATDLANAKSDFPQYRGAGFAVLGKTSLYEVKNQRGSPFSGSPPIAIGLVPLALFNEYWTSVVWYVLTVLIVLHTMWLSARIAQCFWTVGANGHFWSYALAGLLVLPQFWNGLRWQNLSILTTYLLVASLWLYLKNRSCAAGLCLAGSVVLKVFPALLLLYFASKRRYAMVAFTTVWLIFLLVVVPSGVFGWKGSQDYLKQWWTEVCLSAAVPDITHASALFERAYSVARSNNFSLQAVLFQLIAGDRTTFNPLTDQRARSMGRLASVCLLLGGVYILRRGRIESNQARTVLEFCFVLTLLLVLSPVTLFHYFTLLVLPVTVGIRLLFSGTVLRLAWAHWLGLTAYAAGTAALNVTNCLFTHVLFLVGVLVLAASFSLALTHQAGPARAFPVDLAGSHDSDRKDQEEMIAGCPGTPRPGHPNSV